MPSKRYWLLLTTSEDGNPVKRLTDTELAQVLDNPGDWGIDRFVGLDDVPADQNYWPSDVGVLLRCKVIIPVPAGAYRLPDGEPELVVHGAADDWTCLCGWKVDGFTAPELARTKLFDSHILPETRGARPNPFESTAAQVAMLNEGTDE